jgi:biopolymer transport protein ExbD
MLRLDVPEYWKTGPVIPMAPLIDIVFLTLVFFMTLSIFQQMESQTNISVPKSQTAEQSTRSPGEVIINISQEGHFFVNQQALDLEGLQIMLGRVAQLFPDQPVIIRADEKTYHKHVIKALDACAQADIWNISFATLPEETAP